MKQNKNENVCPKNSLDFMDRETGGKIIEEKRGKVVVYAHSLTV